MPLSFCLAVLILSDWSIPYANYGRVTYIYMYVYIYLNLVLLLSDSVPSVYTGTDPIDCRLCRYRSNQSHPTKDINQGYSFSKITQIVYGRWLKMFIFSTSPFF